MFNHREHRAKKNDRYPTGVCGVSISDFLISIPSVLSVVKYLILKICCEVDDATTPFLRIRTYLSKKFQSIFGFF